MTTILIPVLLALLLGPGLGQLYNKEFKKGFVMIALSVDCSWLSRFWLARAVLVYLPSDINTTDRAMLRSIIQHTSSPITPSPFIPTRCSWQAMDLWHRRCVFGGMRRRNSKAAPATLGGSN